LRLGKKANSVRKKAMRNAKKSKSHGSNVKYTKQSIEWKKRLFDLDAGGSFL